MTKISYIGTVKKGVLSITGLDAFKRDLSTLDGDVSIVVSDGEKNRTGKQNAYYWKCLTIFGDHIGYTKDEMHEICRYKFLLMDAGAMPYLESTTDLGVKEFVEYMDKIIKWAFEGFNVSLPSPDEKIFEI